MGFRIVVFGFGFFCGVVLFEVFVGVGFVVGVGFLWGWVLFGGGVFVGFLI